MPPTERRRGLSLIELVVCTVIVGILANTALPVAKNAVRRQKEALLQEHLRTLRGAIDRYYAQQSNIKPGCLPNACYPKRLDDLVVARILRRIPLDPMTGRPDWVMRSTTDPTDVIITDRTNVFDVRSSALGEAIDGTPYASW